TSVGMLAAIPVAGGPVALARALGAAQGDRARQRGLATVGLVAIVLVTAACAVVTAVVLAALGRPLGGALAVLVGMTLFTAAYHTYRGMGSAWRIAVLYAGSNALQLLLVVLLCGLLGWKIPDLALIVYSFAWTLVVLTLEFRAPLDLAWDATAARRARRAVARLGAAGAGERGLRGLGLGRRRPGRALPGRRGGGLLRAGAHDRDGVPAGAGGGDDAALAARGGRGARRRQADG